MQTAALRDRLVGGNEYNSASGVTDAKGQHFGHEWAYLARRKIHYRHHLPANKRFRRIKRGDLRRGFFLANFWAEINHQLERGFARFWKRRHVNNRAAANIQFQELIESG